MSVLLRLKTLYSGSSFLQNLAGQAAAAKPYLRLTKSRAARQSIRDLSGPFNLQIEISSICTARCLMCPYPTMKRKRRLMSTAVFRAVLNRLDKEKLPINKIFLSGMGEPLTHPQAGKFMAAVKKRGYHLRLYTNASLLTAGIARQLVDLRVDEVNISFNGATPAAYRQVMGLDYRRTLNNIERLVQTRTKAGQSMPRIQVSSIVINENAGQIKDHLRSWREKVDAVTVSRAHSWGGIINEKYKIKNEKLSTNNQQLIPHSVFPCRSLWHTFAIDSAGRYVLCCRDYESKHRLGHVTKDSFAGAFRSPVIAGFRRKHLKYDQASLPPMCRGCNMPYQLGLEWWLGRGSD